MCLGWGNGVHGYIRGGPGPTRTLLHPRIQGNLRWTSHCFPIEKAGRQDFTHIMLDLQSIKALKVGKQPEAHGSTGVYQKLYSTYVW